MTAHFVTATGTDVGKTFVVAALIRHLQSRGQHVGAIKPVLSGFDPKSPETSDPGRILQALGRLPTIEEIARIAPWRFAAPLSPDQAARREGTALDFNTLVGFTREAVATRRGRLFIEGIGGIMVPLDDRHTVLDWMSMLRLPILLVAGSYVGTISHTLTAMHVLAGRNLDVTAIVVSESATSAATLGDTVAAISRFCTPVPVVGLPRQGPGQDFERAVAELAAQL